MARFVTNVAANLSGSGDIAGITFDNYSLLSESPTQIAFRYTLSGNPVMDISIGGAFYTTTTNVSGRLTSVVASVPGGGTLVAFDGMNIGFSSVSGLLGSLNLSTWLSGADQIYGSSYADRLYGYAGNDALFGGDGNDTLDGGAGINDIDGGPGTGDVVMRSGLRANGTAVAYNGYVYAGDSTGYDRTTGVEYIRYSDQIVATASIPLFDPLAYLAANRDLAAAFGTNGDAAVNHYMTSGARERRTTAFDGGSYLAANPDLAAAFGTNTTAATLHYIQRGRLEGRSTSFNAMSYLAANPDLITAFATNTTAAMQHYITNGRVEGRSTTFNAAAYLARNPDVQRALGSTELAATTHYVQTGYREGRATTPLTTTARAAGALPLQDASATLAVAGM